MTDNINKDVIYYLQIIHPYYCSGERMRNFYTFLYIRRLSESCLLWDCEAMAKRYLGDTLDIHGGGLGNQEEADLTALSYDTAPARPDLVFPHHENEIAQSPYLRAELSRMC